MTDQTDAEQQRDRLLLRLLKTPPPTAPQAGARPEAAAQAAASESASRHALIAVGGSDSAAPGARSRALTATLDFRGFLHQYPARSPRERTRRDAGRPSEWRPALPNEMLNQHSDG